MLSTYRLHNSIGIASAAAPTMVTTYYKYKDYAETPVFMTHFQRTVGGKNDIQTLGYVGKSWNMTLTMESRAQYEQFINAVGNRNISKVLFVDPYAIGHEAVVNVEGSVTFRAGNKEKIDVPIKIEWTL